MQRVNAEVTVTFAIYRCELCFGVHIYIYHHHMAQLIKAFVRPSDIPKMSVSSIPGEGSGELSEGKLTRDN